MINKNLVYSILVIQYNHKNLSCTSVETEFKAMCNCLSPFVFIRIFNLCAKKTVETTDGMLKNYLNVFTLGSGGKVGVSIKSKCRLSQQIMPYMKRVTYLSLELPLH